MRALALILLGLLVLTAVFFFVSGSEAVEVTACRVERGSVSDKLDEDGLVKSGVEAALSPRVQGRLARLLARTGERVEAGQLVAELESDDLKAALRVAQANEQAAAAALEQARARLAAEQRAVAAELTGSQAAREVASANLDRLENGSRPQELSTARAQLTSAEAAERESRANLTRSQQLFEQGYVSAQQVDAARTALSASQASREQARQHLSLLREGARQEERQAARGELARAGAQVEGARARQGQLAVMEGEVAASSARLEAASASVAQARAQLAQTEVRAPGAGEIVLEDVQPGESVGPTVPVARLVDPDRIWVEVLLDENDRGKVSPGQSVLVTTDAYPEVEFAGKLKSIDALAQLKRELRGTPTQDEDRVFRARIELASSEGNTSQLFPGMSVFAEVVLRKLENVLFVPREALVSREGKWVVLAVDGSRAHQRVVKTGSRDASRVEIVEGLSEGDQVVLNPGNLRDGARLRLKP